MRCAALGSIAWCALVGACAAVPPPAPAAVVAGARIDDGVEVRMGCTLVTRAEVDRAAARAQALGLVQTREQARDAAIRRALAVRIADERGLAVSSADVDAALAGLAAEHGTSVPELLAAAAGMGLDEAAYRTELEQELLEGRVGAWLVEERSSEPGSVAAERTPAAVERAYAEEASARMERGAWAIPWDCTEDPPR